jgi:chitinase
VNDDGAAYLSVGNTSVTEGYSGTATATFTITRSGNTSGSSTVSYRTTNGTATAGTDYSAVALTAVTYAPGETSKTVTVDVTGDIAVEKNETFNLVLSAPGGATVADASGAGTIANDD